MRSANKIAYAAVGRKTTATANAVKSKACKGRNAFHHMRSPNTSAPVFRAPVANMYKNPIETRIASTPMSCKTRVQTGVFALPQ